MLQFRRTDRPDPYPLSFTAWKSPPCNRLAGQDGLVHARVIRAGKTLAFGEIDIQGARDLRSVCRASTTYALL